MLLLRCNFTCKFIQSIPKRTMSSENKETRLTKSEAAETTEPKDTHKKSHKCLHWTIEFVLLCVMLVLALVGMGITQASVDGAWEYWLIAVLAFAGIGIYRDFVAARQFRLPIWKSIGRQLCHWLVLLLVLKTLFWMERYDAISREAASVASLLLLAVTCIQAGLHFHWTFAIVGVLLAVMSVVLGTLEQYMLMAWLIMVPLTIAGAVIYFLKAKKTQRAIE